MANKIIDVPEDTSETRFSCNDFSAHLDESKTISAKELQEICRVFNQYFSNIGHMDTSMTHTQMMRLVQKAFYDYFGAKKTYIYNALFDEKTKAYKNYINFEYNFFGPNYQWHASSNIGLTNGRYVGLPTYLFRMAFALKRIKPDILIDSATYDNDVANCLAQVQQELGISETPGWSNYQSEILFSLFEIKYNNANTDSRLCDIAKYINHFRANEVLVSIHLDKYLADDLNFKQLSKAQIKQENKAWRDGKYAQKYGLLPTSGFNINTDYAEYYYYKSFLLNGTLERYLACQGIEPGHWTNQEMDLEIPTCSSSNHGYGNNMVDSYNYAHDLLRDALYLNGYTNAYSDTDQAYAKFRKDTDLDSQEIDERFIRLLFGMAYHDNGVKQYSASCERIDSKNKSVIQTLYRTKGLITYLTYDESTNATYIHQAPDKYEPSVQASFIKEPTQTSPGYYTTDAHNTLDLRTDSICRHLVPFDSAHTQTLIPAIKGLSNVWFVGIHGAHTTKSDINWAQDFARINIASDTDMSQPVDTESRIVDVDTLVPNTTRTEAAITPDFKYFVIFVNDSTNDLHIFVYSLSMINQLLNKSTVVDLADKTIKPAKTWIIKDFKQYCPSVQGFSLDNNLTIYASCQKAAKVDSETGLLNIDNEPRRVAIFPWQNLDNTTIINLCSGMLVLSTPPASLATTELEGLQFTAQHQLQLLVMEHQVIGKTLMSIQTINWQS